MYFRILLIVLVALLSPQRGHADLIEFNGCFICWRFGVNDDFNTIDFTGFDDGTLITTQYKEVGIVFTNSVFIRNLASFSDDWGLTGLNGIRMEFDSPQHAFAVHYLGDVVFQLSYQGNVVATSSWFGATIPGPLKFAGVISDEPFDEVYLFVPQPPFSNNVVTIDNLYWSAVPAPGALPLLAFAALCRTRRRR